MSTTEKKPKIISGSPLELFNVHFVDFVKQNTDGTYTAVEWPTQASHELIPTSWNTPDKVKPNKRGKTVLPGGIAKYALSVCAMPYTHRRRTYQLEVRRSITKDMPAYAVAATLEAKKTVLKALFSLCAVPMKYRRRLKDADHLECDRTYRAIVQSSQLLKS